MGRILSSWVKRTFRACGMDVQRLRNSLTDENVLSMAFRRFGPDLVVDVGANTGQYAKLVRSIGYVGNILSIEPLPEAHNSLKTNAAADDKWQVARRLALGPRVGVAKMYVAGNSTSSSTKAMMQAHVDAAPNSAIVSEIDVDVTTVDCLMREMPHQASRPYLKIDTQGAEIDVLMGATEFLSVTVAVQIELSLAQLYEGQSSVSGVVGLLGNAGLELVALIPGFREPSTGRLLQCDGIFARH